MNYFYLYIDDEKIKDINMLWWDKLISKYLKENNNFEIRCWNGQDKEIKDALYFGEINKTNQNKEYILNNKTINNTNKLTQFFTINLGENFSSEHYGTEIIIKKLSRLDINEIKKIIKPVESYISYSFD